MLFTLRCGLLALFVCICFLNPWAASSMACPFCSSQGQTLSSEVKQADLVLFGSLFNAKRDLDEFGKGTTEMNVEIVVKPHPYLAGRKKITLPRYVPLTNSKEQNKYLVFCEVYKDQIDPYRGIAVRPDSKIATYLRDAIEVKKLPVSEQLAFFFRHLDSDDPDISNDAYMEFGNSDYRDFRVMAEKLNPDQILKWLQNPNTPVSRYGLYGSMLGHCGRQEHAAEVRKLLDHFSKRFSSGIDGILAAYVLLDRKQGWQYIHRILANEGDQFEFLLRYAALRAVRFFWEYRQDVLPRETLLEGIQLLLDQSDIADLPIDDLRKWEVWELSGKILKLYDRPSHSVPIVKRAILRFALSAPSNQHDTYEFIEQVRADDPSRVTDIEELLYLEFDAQNKVQPTTTPARTKQ